MLTKHSIRLEFRHQLEQNAKKGFNVIIRTRESGCEIWAPAKINLSLDVLNRRSDGFHEIETLITTVSHFDTLHFQSVAGGQIEIRNRPTWFNSESSTIPTDEANLAVKAVLLVREAAVAGSASVEKFGAKMTLIKRIPHAAGLGGGSSDAAAALLAANLVWQLGFSTEKLRDIAAEIGSDVPAFLAKSPILCSGRGERLAAGPSLSRLNFVITKPPVGLRTPEVYAACQPGGKPTDWKTDTPNVGGADFVAERMSNDLQSSAEKITDWIVRLGRVFGQLDVIAHQMSGSGSAYFAVCRPRCSRGSRREPNK